LVAHPASHARQQYLLSLAPITTTFDYRELPQILWQISISSITAIFGTIV
jgi:hypothetical protein